MKLIEAAVVVAITTLVPFLAHATSMNTTDSSLPYCNNTDEDRVTTSGEVCTAIFDALNKIDDLCTQKGIVSLLPQNKVCVCMIQVTFFSNAGCLLEKV